MTQLSDHFSLAEAVFSDTALRMGIDNAPSEKVLANMRQAALIGMEPIRRLLNVPVRVNSWFRCEELEKALCRKDYARWCAKRRLPAFDESGEFGRAWATYFALKQHPQGFAIDWVAPDFGTPAECSRAVRDSGIKFDQLIMEGTWCHASFAPAMRRQILSATFENGTPSYSQGIS
jgi:zinc D-Ala-D-Ala carboxypeptidase